MPRLPRWNVYGERSLNTPKGDRLDVLATLIDVYENEHYPMDPPDPIEAIKFRMEQQSLTRKDLEGIVGSRTRIAEILKSSTSPVHQHDPWLHEKLGISTDILIRPSQIKTTRTKRAA